MVQTHKPILGGLKFCGAKEQKLILHGLKSCNAKHQIKISTYLYKYKYSIWGKTSQNNQ